MFEEISSGSAVQCGQQKAPQDLKQVLSTILF